MKSTLNFTFYLSRPLLTINHKSVAPFMNNLWCVLGRLSLSVCLRYLAAIHRTIYYELSTFTFLVWISSFPRYKWCKANTAAIWRTNRYDSWQRFCALVVDLWVFDKVVKKHSVWTFSLQRRQRGQVDIWTGARQEPLGLLGDPSILFVPYCICVCVCLCLQSVCVCVWEHEVSYLLITLGLVGYNSLSQTLSRS